MRLSVKAVQEVRESGDVREYTERTQVTTEEGLGSLADKLRGALEPREK